MYFCNVGEIGGGIARRGREFGGRLRGRLVPDHAAGRFLSRLVRVAALVALVLGTPSFSFATAVTLPDTGVDLPGLVNAGLVAIGAAITIIVGAYFGYLAIRIVMRWARSMA